MKFILLIVSIAGGYWFYTTQISKTAGGVDPAKLDLRVQKMAEASANDPAKKVTTTDLQTLSNAMNRADDPHTKAYLIRLISLGMLAQNKLNDFRLFRKKVEKNNPQEDFFAFMNEDFPGMCPACEGKGSSKCTKCKGTGNCSNHLCKDGRIKYESLDKIEDKECIICKGTAKCKFCEATGIGFSACSKCKGAGQTTVTASKAEQLYKETLKEAQ